jgi:hypothetical protein
MTSPRSGSGRSNVVIKDIAEHMGLHVTTVSKALLDNPEIGDATKERVRAVADKQSWSDRAVGACRTVFSRVMDLDQTYINAQRLGARWENNSCATGILYSTLYPSRRRGSADMCVGG